MDHLAKVVQIIQQDGPARGLILSTKSTVPANKLPKSTIWCPDLLSPVLDPLGLGIPRVQESGIVLLGSPIGSHHFIHDKIRDKIQSVLTITRLLPLLKDPHLEYVLLRSCFSLPKIVFLLRSTDPTQHQALWAAFDTLIRDSLTNILGKGINDQQWAQAQLPVSMGGLGLRSAVEHSSGAYISSVMASEALKEGLLPHGTISINVSSAMAILKLKVGGDMSDDELFEMPQRGLRLKIDLPGQFT